MLFLLLLLAISLPGRGGWARSLPPEAEPRHLLDVSDLLDLSHQHSEVVLPEEGGDDHLEMMDLGAANSNSRMNISLEEEQLLLKARRESSEALSSMDRAKASRREMIREQIESLLGIRGKQLPSVKDVLNEDELATAWHQLEDQSGEHGGGGELLQLPSATAPPDADFRFTDFTEKQQSAFPECHIPRRISRHLSHSPTQMHLYFKSKLDGLRQGYTTTVISGDLRLFFQPKEETILTAGSYDTLEPDSQNDGPTQMEAPEQKYRLTVFWVRRSRHKGHKELTLLDSRMISMDTAQWVTLDARTAVRHWTRRPKRNYGLVVTLEDERMRGLDPAHFIRMRNCSDAETLTSFPSILDAGGAQDDVSAEDHAAGAASRPLFNTERYPMLDVSTVQVPDGEMLSLSELSMLQIRLNSMRRRPSLAPASPPSEEVPLPEESAISPAPVPTEMEAFPILHNVHVRHGPSGSPAAIAPVVPATTSPRPEAVTEQAARDLLPYPNHRQIIMRNMEEATEEDAEEDEDWEMPTELILDGKDLAKYPFMQHTFQELEKVQEINYRQPLHHQHHHQQHQQRLEVDEAVPAERNSLAKVEFRPTKTRVVLTADEMSQMMLERVTDAQQAQVNLERTFLDALKQVERSNQQQEQQQEQQPQGD